jgi:MinD-like ATPase involved in chromosome partitioning or flagellar assembly
VAVWGPTGAPGRTTLAVGIAAAAAAGGTRTLLVDADPYGGAVAQVLGLLEEAPGLAAAARAATAGVLDPAGLAVHCRDLLQPSGLLVLPGLLRAERWPELRPSSVAAVLEVARLLAPLVVVDCGFCLEADEELSYDGLAPRRNGVTLEVLAGADQVIAVGSADPLGLQRLLRGLSALSDAVSLRRPAGVVLNRVRPLHGRGSSDAAAREAAGVVRRHLGRDPIGWIPLDQEAMDRAVAVGRTLAEVAPRSPARIALDRLAATVTAAFAPAQRTLRPQVAR